MEARACWTSFPGRLASWTPHWPLNIAFPAIYSNFIGQFDGILDILHRWRTMILLDPGRFLNRLAADLI